MQYPKFSNELIAMLAQDQTEMKELARLYISEGATESYSRKKAVVQSGNARRVERALAILAEVKEPSLSNIGKKGSLALSVLALHASFAELETVTDAFQRCYDRDKKDCAYDLIPAMVDWLLIQRGMPQEFGTQWLFDEHNYPFLPTVDRFTTIEELNVRRAVYGRESHKWPKSLVMTDQEQPWLKRPLSEAVMRMPTKRELDAAITRK
jgi:hypothetical protein